jgi:arginyl-tRNA synthetase
MDDDFMKKGWKEELADSLSQTSGAKFEDAFSSLCAPKGAQADWCSTLAFSLAKTQKANPVALATKWANEAKWPKFVSRAQASGPYLNFYFAKNFWGKIVGQISKSKKPTGKKQKIIIEFPSVNPNKPWHAGHMRNAI